MRSAVAAKRVAPPPHPGDLGRTYLPAYRAALQRTTGRAYTASRDRPVMTTAMPPAHLAPRHRRRQHAGGRGQTWRKRTRFKTEDRTSRTNRSQSLALGPEAVAADSRRANSKQVVVHRERVRRRASASASAARVPDPRARQRRRSSSTRSATPTRWASRSPEPRLTSPSRSPGRTAS